MRCWGFGASGQLGYGNDFSLGTSPNTVPAQNGNVEIGGVAVDIWAGANHSCALLDDGDVRCWGKGKNGALGYGDQHTIGDNELPNTVGPVMLGESVSEGGAGSAHTRVLLESGTVRCWGWNSFGQLGLCNLFSVGDDEHPVDVDPIALE